MTDKEDRLFLPSNCHRIAFRLVKRNWILLDEIGSRVKSMEDDLKYMMSSLEFVHAEVTDLKEENEKRKAEGHKTEEKLEDLNTALKNRVIDLQARSMRDNVIFYNINEMKDEDQTDIVHGILENQLEFVNAKDTVKIDRAHRLGRPIPALFTTRPRAIVCKFIFFRTKKEFWLTLKS